LRGSDSRTEATFGPVVHQQVDVGTLPVEYVSVTGRRTVAERRHPWRRSSATPRCRGEQLSCGEGANRPSLCDWAAALVEVADSRWALEVEWRHTHGYAEPGTYQSASVGRSAHQVLPGRVR
jgi:hypothetical protein